jgi:hypothetical protein
VVGHHDLGFALTAFCAPKVGAWGCYFGGIDGVNLHPGSVRELATCGRGLAVVVAGGLARAPLEILDPAVIVLTADL